MAEGKCVFCDGPINPDRDYRKVIGYEKHRSQGGTNAVRLRQPQQEWACAPCVGKQAAGISVAQVEMGF